MLYILQVFQRHVASVCSKCFICFRRTLQAFFYLDVAHVSHICCKSMFEMFQLFQSYVAISVFMLQVASVFIWMLHCFTYMLQVYVLNVSSASDVCYLKKCFHVVSVSYFRGMFKESWGMAQHRGKGRDEPEVNGWGTRCAWGPADGARSSSSRLPGPARVEREEGSGERSGRCGVGRGERGTGYACEAGRGV
jgi:hypothetical protein